VSFTLIDAPQLSPEWFAARVGRVTGSKADAVIDFLKTGKESAARRDYRMQLVTERLTGTVDGDGFVSDAMKRGIELEPDAFRAYESETGNLATRTGFLSHDDYMAGCSLDGHVGEYEGIIEIKCPKSATHLRYLQAKTLPADYVAQVTHNLWISGAAWCDFVSYDDRFPAHLRILVVRVLAKDLDLAGYETAALNFINEVSLAECELRAR